MKIDLNEPMRRSAVRTIDAFTKELFQFLKTKPLEDISIGELCDAANYPRSTFYNYFDDIYDLTNCLWSRIAMEIDIDSFNNINHTERTKELFNRIYEYMKSMEDSINIILKHNDAGGKLIESLKKYMTVKIRKIMDACPESTSFPIPYAIMVMHYSNTITMILEQCFLQRKKLTKEEALKYLDYLIGTLERNK